MTSRRSLPSEASRDSRHSQFRPGHIGGRVASAQPVNRLSNAIGAVPKRTVPLKGRAIHVVRGHVRRKLSASTGTFDRLSQTRIYVYSDGRNPATDYHSTEWYENWPRVTYQTFDPNGQLIRNTNAGWANTGQLGLYYNNNNVAPVGITDFFGTWLVEATATWNDGLVLTDSFTFYASKGVPTDEVLSNTGTITIANNFKDYLTGEQPVVDAGPGMSTYWAYQDEGILHQGPSFTVTQNNGYIFRRYSHGYSYGFTGADGVLYGANGSSAQIVQFDGTIYDTPPDVASPWPSWPNGENEPARADDWCPAYDYANPLT